MFVQTPEFFGGISTLSTTKAQRICSGIFPNPMLENGLNSWHILNINKKYHKDCLHSYAYLKI